MKNYIHKGLIVAFFILFIFIIPIINIFTEDKKISELENKILTQLPELSFNSIKSKRFMDNFDKYTSDQFPLRSDFIKLKNSYSYAIGHREFRDIYISSNNRLMEKFIFSNDIINKNIDGINNIANHLNLTKDIKSTIMVVPTSIIFYENELPSFILTDNQVDTLEYINKNVSSDYTYFYTPYDILNTYKNEYIYFNTDHHWTQLGAYISYLDMFGYDMDDSVLSNNYINVSNNFYGTYYSKALLPNIKPDSIYSYQNYNNFDIEIDLSSKFSTLYDDSKLDGKNKYQYFLHGDPAFCVIEGNPNKSDELLIFKDSYAHNFIPFLTSNYKKIHVVDPRYYNINLDDYLLQNKGINEAFFINNIQLLNSDFVYDSSLFINK